MMNGPREAELERIRWILEGAQIALDGRRFADSIEASNKALALIEKAMGLVRRPDGSYSTAPGAPEEFDIAFAKEQANAHEIRGIARRHAGQLHDSFEDLMLAAEIQRNLSADDELPSESLAVTLHNLGNTLMEIASPKSRELASAAFAEAIDIREAVMAVPGHSHVANFLAGTYKARANLEIHKARTGNPADLTRAEADLRRALEIRSDLVAIDGRHELLGTVAMTRYSLAEVLGMTFRFPAAIVLLDQAVAVVKELVASGQSHLRDDLALCLSARVLYGIGLAETVSGAAWPVSESLECAALYGELIGEGRLDQLDAFGEFISQRALPCLFKSGDVHRAAQVLEESLRTVIDRLGRDRVDLVLRIGVLMCAVPEPVKQALISTSPGLAHQLARLERLN